MIVNTNRSLKIFLLSIKQRRLYIYVPRESSEMVIKVEESHLVQKCRLKNVSIMGEREVKQTMKQIMFYFRGPSGIYFCKITHEVGRKLSVVKSLSLNKFHQDRQDSNR